MTREKAEPGDSSDDKERRRVSSRPTKNQNKYVRVGRNKLNTEYSEDEAAKRQMLIATMTTGNESVRSIEHDRLKMYIKTYGIYVSFK